MDFAGIFSRFAAGEYDYKTLSDYVRNFNNEVASDSGISMITGITGVLPMHFVMIAAMIVIAFWGKKLLPLINFITIFTLGFGFGIYFVHERLSAVLPLPSIVSGLLIGILAAIIYRLLYIFLFTGAVFYGTYTLCYAALGTMLAALGDLKGFVFMGVAAVVVIFALIFRKYAEMLGTAVLGGAVVARLVSVNIFDLSALIPAAPWLMTAIVIFVIAIPGFIVQYNTRRRY